jgi:hypothetical protein
VYKMLCSTYWAVSDQVCERGERAECGIYRGYLEGVYRCDEGWVNGMEEELVVCELELEVLGTVIHGKIIVKNCQGITNFSLVLLNPTCKRCVDWSRYLPASRTDTYYSTVCRMYMSEKVWFVSIPFDHSTSFNSWIIHYYCTILQHSPIEPFKNWTIRPPNNPSNHQSIYPSTSPSIHQSTHPSIHRQFDSSTPFNNWTMRLLDTIVDNHNIEKYNYFFRVY